MVHISHKYKFIYLKNVKVAGSYLAMILTKYCTIKENIEDSRWYKVFSNKQYLEQNSDIGFIAGSSGSPGILSKFKYPQHLPANIIKEKFPNIFDDYFKFCVVRNPYDRIVSRYYWDLHTNVIPKDMSFTNFLENEGKKKINKMNDDWYHRCTIDNQPICDFYIRFDNLIPDIQKLFDKLSITDSIIDKDINKNPSKKCKDYHSMFNNYTKNIVTKHCQEEIDYFNWKF